MEFIPSAGYGWQMKVAEVHVNLQNKYSIKCNLSMCDLKCDSLEELHFHIQSKHCFYMPNEVGAGVQNQQNNLLLSLPIPPPPPPNMVTTQFPGKIHYNPAQPPPSIPSTSSIGQNDGRNNANLFGAATSTAATFHTIAAQHSTISKSNTQKREVKKMEHHSRSPYNCTMCQKVFGNCYELDRHKKKCLNKRFRCDCCKQPFETLQGKQGHERKIHCDIFKYPCSECIRAFKRYSDFVDHNRRHTNPLIKCDFCSKMVCTKYGKIQHIKKRHPERRYHCRLCKGKGFSSALFTTMTRHYVDKHGSVPKSGI